MSLATTIGASTLLGGLLAVGVYTAMAPADQVPASLPATPTYAPVATPTVTQEADDCVAPAVLEHDECVVHKPGPTITLAPVTQAPATHQATESSSGHTSRPSATYDSREQSEDRDDDAYEHEDGEHEDEHDGDHDGGGEHGDD